MQDHATGLFADPLLQQFPVQSAIHDEEYLLFQMTYFTLHALDALDAEPLHPLSFTDTFLEPHALQHWIDQLDWSNAWLQSNRVMFVMSFLIYRAERQADRHFVDHPLMEDDVELIDVAEDGS